MKKRTYNTQSRDAQAFKTKKSILKSAKKLFKEKGFSEVTIGEIARAAQVSTPTIYAVFKSKKGVLQALIDQAMPADQFSSYVDEFMVQKDPKEALAITARMTKEMYDSEREFISLLKGSSIISPELKKLEAEREKRRYQRQREAIEKLSKHKSFSKELTLSKARDVLWTLTSREIYRLMVTERGWSSDAFEKWLHDILIKSLLK